MDVTIAIAGGKFIGARVDRDAAHTFAGNFEMFLHSKRRNIHNDHHAIAQGNERLIACKANVENARISNVRGFFNRVSAGIQHLNTFKILADPQRTAAFV